MSTRRDEGEGSPCWLAGGVAVDHDVPVTFHGTDDTDDRLAVEDVRTFVPAENFARSKQFYEALGGTTTWTDGTGLALLELGGYRFMLQDFYVQDWAENFMLTIVMRDASAWYSRISAALADGDFGDARVAEPKVEPWGATVTSAWDPCGVLLHFTEFHSS